MTTTVTVKTHDHPAYVRTYPCVDHDPVENGQWSAGEIVEPHSEREFHVHSAQNIMVGELPLDV